MRAAFPHTRFYLAQAPCNHLLAREKQPVFVVLLVANADRVVCFCRHITLSLSLSLTHTHGGRCHFDEPVVEGLLEKEEVPNPRNALSELPRTP